MENKTIAEIIVFSLICFVSGIFVCWSIPTHIWRDNDYLKISFVLGPKKSIELHDSTIIPAPLEIIAPLQRINGLESGKKRAGIWEDTNTHKKYHLYTIGKGELVMFEARGETFITDGYYTNGYSTKKRFKIKGGYPNG